MTVRIGLAGGRGYVGEEILKLLLPLKNYEVVYIGSRGLAGKPVASEYQNLPTEQLFQDLSVESLRACEADIWILAQGNGQASDLAKVLDNDPSRLIDISSDFRFDEQWVYGLPEKNRSLIANAKYVSNPGCYATAAQLALLPIRDRIQGMPAVFGVSGFSGAGRTPSEKNDPKRLKDNILPYSLTGHTHEKEISRHLGHAVRFAPHVSSFFRGISVTVKVSLAEPQTDEGLVSHFQDFYRDFPLVQATQEIPEIQQVAETNRAIVGGFAVDERDAREITVVCAIDNLRKGAASQLIQNLNLMCGYPSEQGLLS